jgi:hypothetical protein
MLLRQTSSPFINTSRSAPDPRSLGFIEKIESYCLGFALVVHGSSYAGRSFEGGRDDDWPR